ncbi:YihY/virulence factor BrkB family protein [Streptomyces sp. ACA25]|uniref:YihY/virulence factor BrkB family protein n=1 Tax=Streptomyces sp. ACA25 TaxID=3022596 RepID=UPI002307E0A9|nr:YihY/virulence factor BrkB family protein [Streptomyces sp. ACA25]MDB1089196.1 YihY/virulence factor BrkB family protein [Streptomyces sp. ACA25]
MYRNIPKGKLLWNLGKDTVKSCSEHRVIGMAAESAFFMLLSLPPLLLGLVGLLSSLDAVSGTSTLETVHRQILDASSVLLSERGVEDFVRPLIDDLVQGARPDVMSFGFLVALWSGSRAVNVFVGTITVMYGLVGHRNPAATRLLAFTMYVISLLVGAVVVPAMLIGPELAMSWFPQLSGLLRVFYWPLVLLLCVGFLTTLYHVSVPVRSPWREDIPGALLALAIWAMCAYALRMYLRSAVEGQSVYGSLAAPVAILLWLGMSAFAVLVGAALNAAVDRVWPTATTAAARAETERAREEAAEAMAAAVESRRSRAEIHGVPEPDNSALTRRLTALLSPAEMRRQLKSMRGRKRREGQESHPRGREHRRKSGGEGP